MKVKIFFIGIFIALAFVYLLSLRQKPKCASFTKEKAVEIVKTLPEVKQYLLSPVVNTDKSISYEYFVEEDKTQSTKNTKNIWVYSYIRYKDTPEGNHAVTFNRYSVDNYSGKIECSLHIYDKGKYIRMSKSNEYRCY